MSILNENWHTWYIGGVDSKSRLRFLKFRPQKPFFGKFGPKNSKLSVLSENWCTQYLKDADSESRLRFLKFQPQNPFLGKFRSRNLKLFLMSKKWYTWYLKDADSESRYTPIILFINICVSSYFYKLSLKNLYEFVYFSWGIDTMINMTEILMPQIKYNLKYFPNDLWWDL